jgi:hypothetical protein
VDFFHQTNPQFHRGLLSAAPPALEQAGFESHANVSSDVATKTPDALAAAVSDKPQAHSKHKITAAFQTEEQFCRANLSTTVRRKLIQDLFQASCKVPADTIRRRQTLR